MTDKTLADRLQELEQLRENGHTAIARKAAAGLFADTIEANLPAILSALREREVMREALEESAKTFRKYEASHDAKGTVEGKQKAAANAFMATKCERALQGDGE